MATMLSMVAMLSTSSALQTSQPRPGQRLAWDADDAKRIATLEATGRKTEGKLAVLWTPAGALDDAESAKLIERVDKGLAALRKVIGTHPWQAVRDQRIRYYISDDPFVSHSVNGTEVVLMPLARLRDGRAPFFHEAAHALLGRALPPGAGPLDPASLDRVTATRPMWLLEGIAEYFGKSAAQLAGVVDGDPFDSGGLEGMDSDMRSALSSPTWRARASIYWGTWGTGRVVHHRAAEDGADSHPCSFSFTKHVAKLIGDQELIGLMDLQSRVDRNTTPVGISADGVLPRIEQLSGKTREQVKADWFRSLPKS